jgi:uroporphyrinogen-III synthase
VSSSDKQLLLQNRTIVVTRGKEQAKEFSDILERNGARVLLFPAVEIVEPEAWSECDSALTQLHKYSGVIFTSTNAVEFFFRRAENKRVVEQIQKCKLYAVGEKTKNTINSFGFQTERIPGTFSSEELANDLVKASVHGKRFLFPKGNLAKDDIVSKLSSHGAVVDSVTVYRTQEPPFDDMRQQMMRVIEERADMITFFSPSSVNHFVRRASKQMMQKKEVAVIGETTADAARRLGLSVVLVSPQSTVESFVEAITKYYTSL